MKRTAILAFALVATALLAAPALADWESGERVDLGWHEWVAGENLIIDQDVTLYNCPSGYANKIQLRAGVGQPPFHTAQIGELITLSDRILATADGFKWKTGTKSYAFGDGFSHAVTFWSQASTYIGANIVGGGLDPDGISYWSSTNVELRAKVRWDRCKIQPE